MVGPDSKQIGVMPLNRALYIAKDLELDLVEVAPEANPPVCRVIDFGKYKYEQQKREKSQKKQHRNQQVKEMVFRPSIEKHDFEVKIRHIKKFLEAGHKTKVIVRFRRAELAHKERGSQLLLKIEKELEQLGKVTRLPQMFGSSLIMVLAPTGVKKDAEIKDEEISSQEV